MSQLTLKSLNAILADLNVSVDKATDFYYDILYELSTTIFKKRMTMDMNQTKFAKYLGVSQAMVSKYESGDYNFTIKQLCNLAEKLDMIPTFALFDTAEMTPQDYQPKNADIDTIPPHQLEEAA
ncbi:MAG: helix-turn-helix domain-containing protein [Candidatus Ornithomonoglobus sp.]